MATEAAQQTQFLLDESQTAEGLVQHPRGHARALRAIEGLPTPA